MKTRVQWLGHSCLLLESNGDRILIDPFLTGNPSVPVQASEPKPDDILLSHGHSNHMGDASAIAKRTKAQDALAWAERVRRTTTRVPVVMQPGEWLDL